MPVGRIFIRTLSIGMVIAFTMCVSSCLDEVSLVPDLFANGCEQQPVMTLLQPQDGQTVGEAIPFELELSHFAVSEEHYNGANVACEGHLHIFVENTYLGAQFQLSNAEIDIADFGAGELSFRVEAHTNDHALIADIEAIELMVLKQ